jgi:very-long-chain ceramide synthase
MRHYINLKILYSIVTSYSQIGPFELNWVTQQYKCRLSQYITFALLASLQAINLFWFFLILRIGWNTLINDTPKDERSDDEATDAEEEEVRMEKPIAKRKGLRAAASNGKAPGSNAFTTGTNAAPVDRKSNDVVSVPNGTAKTESIKDR